jgi:sec-independent protein translocase protein TatB
MPTIGWFEILIIVAIAIVVIGPKDFPFMLRKAGSWIGVVKKYISNIQNEVADLELDNIQSEEPKIKDKDKVENNDKT